MIDLKQIKVGDPIRVRVVPTNFLADGKIIWIHPERRFFRVEFVTNCGETYHECFHIHESEKVLQEEV